MVIISYEPDRLLNRINNEVTEGAYLTSEDQYVLEEDYGTAVVTVEDETAEVEGLLNQDKKEALERVLEQEDLV